MELKAVWNKVIPKSKHFDPSMGEVVSSKIATFYRIEDAEEFNTKFSKWDQNLGLKTVSNSELAQIYQNDPDQFRKDFLDKDYMLLMWVSGCY